MYDTSLKYKWDNANVVDTARKEGEEQKSYTVVENLLLSFGFTDEQAAKATEVSVEFVKKVRLGLKNKA